MLHCYVGFTLGMNGSIFEWFNIRKSMNIIYNINKYEEKML